LQNQEIEGFSVRGSRLLGLEGEAVQIQLFICSPLLDFSGSEEFGTLRIFIPLFGPFANVSLLSYCFLF